MQDEVNTKLKEFQETMRAEDEAVKTLDAKERLDNKKSLNGKDRVIQNMRGWVYGEQEWANQGINDTITLAEQIRLDNKEAFVQVGVGGSDQTTKAIVNATISTQHNLLTKAERGGAPQIYYTGDQFDGNVTFDILEALWTQGNLFKTIFNITSKSGTTAETVHTFLIIRTYLDEKLAELRDKKTTDEDLAKLGLTKEDLKISKLKVKGKKEKEDYFHTGRFFVFTTGQNEASALFDYATTIKQEQVEDRVYGMLPVPEGTGGRYSFATAVGMLAMGVSANAQTKETPHSKIRNVLRAVKDVREEMLNGNVEGDDVAAYAMARANYIAEMKHSLGTVAVYPFASKLAEFANLTMQLSTESIQEHRQGQNVLPLVGPSRNHSVVNGFIGGPRDKIVHFIKLAKFDKTKDRKITGGQSFGGDLKALEGLKQSDVQNSSAEGTLEDLIESGIPSSMSVIPELTPYYVAKLIVYFQFEVALEGQLRGLREEANEDDVYIDLTYLQDAVVGYKNKIRAKIKIIQQQRRAEEADRLSKVSSLESSI